MVQVRPGPLLLGTAGPPVGGSLSSAQVGGTQPNFIIRGGCAWSMGQFGRARRAGRRPPGSPGQVAQPHDRHHPGRRLHRQPGQPLLVRPPGPDLGTALGDLRRGRQRLRAAAGRGTAAQGLPAAGGTGPAVPPPPVRQRRRHEEAAAGDTDHGGLTGSRGGRRPRHAGRCPTRLVVLGRARSGLVPEAGPAVVLFGSVGSFALTPGRVG